MGLGRFGEVGVLLGLVVLMVVVVNMGGNVMVGKVMDMDIDEFVVVME